ncbi:MAG: PAS domain S-box protein [Anaerolineae bacterium]|nr:PAS domain S-box protein [Anaerolineae bacterium]
MHQARILIVEDELLVGRNIAYKLEQAGHEVVGIATNSDDAIQIAAQSKPDLIVMDIQLEDGIDGIQAAKQIQSQMNVPIIYLTAHADDEILNRARVTEPFGYILKPFQDRELFSNVEIALYKHEMDQRLRANQAELEAIFNSTLTMMVVVDRERRVWRANQAARENGCSLDADVELRAGDLLRCVNALSSPCGCGFGPNCAHCVVRQTILDTLGTGRAHRQVGASLTLIVDGCAREHTLLVSTTPLDTDGELLALVCLDDVTALKQTQDTLSKERQLLRTVIDNLPDAIYAKDLEGRKTLANRADVANIGAASEADVLGKTDFELFPLEVAEQFYANDQRVLQTGQPVFNQEEPLVNERGKQIWLNTSKLPLKDSVGEIIGLVGIGRDVSAQREVEEALRHSEEQYRTLFETMQEAFALHALIFDDQGMPCDYRFLQINPAFERLTGLRAQDILGKTVLEVMPDTESYWIETYSQVALTGEPVQFENYASALEKYYQVMAFSPRPGHFATIFIDITERKQAEINLEKSRYELQVTLDATTDGIWMWHFETGELDFSPRYYTMLGYTPNEFPASFEAWQSLIHPDDLEHALSVASEWLQTKQDRYDNEFRLKTKSGAYHWIYARGKVVERDESGRAIHMIGNHEDVTERKQAEQSLRKSEEKYRTLFEHMAQGVFYQQADGQLVDVNPAALDMFGLTRDQFLGRTSMDPTWKVVREDKTLLDGQEHPSMVALRTGKPLFDVRVGVFNPQRDDYVWMNTSAIPQFKPGESEPFQVFVTIHDITERKRAQDELQKTTELLDAVREAQSLYIAQDEPQPVFDALLQTVISMTGSEFGFLDEVLHDVDGTLYKVNLAISNIAWDDDSRALYEQLRKRSLEFRNLTNLAGLPVLLQEPIIANDAARDARSGGLPEGHPQLRSFMGLPVHAGGELVGVIGVANRPGGYDEAMTRFLRPYLSACAGIIQSVRLRASMREAERALIESEARYREIFMNAPLGIFRSTFEGQFLAVNPALAQMLGYDSPDDVVREITSISEQIYVRPQDRQKIVTPQLDQSEFTHHCNRYRRKDGSEFVANLYLKTVFDAHNKPAFLEGIVEDITERIQAEAALQESEERFRILVESSPMAVVMMREGKYVYGNPASTRLLGLTDPKEIVGLDALSTIAPEFRPLVRERMGQIQQGQDNSPIEMQIIKPNGQAVWTISTSVSIEMDGQPTSVIVGQDVTDLKQAEQALRQSEETLNEAQEIAGVGSYIWDLRTDALEWSRHMFAIAGLDPDVFYGNLQDTINRSIHADDRESVQQQVAQMVEQKRTWPIEFRLVRPDGEVRWLRSGSRFEFDEQGSPVVCIGVHYDITERRQVEQALRQSEARFRTLSDLAPVGVYQTDAQGRCQYVNERWLEMAGLTFKQALGDGWVTGIHPQDRDLIASTWYKMVESQGRWGLEYRFQTPEGKTTWVFGLATPLFDGYEQITGYIGANMDITDRKAAEAEQERLLAEMQQLIAAVPEGVIWVDNAGHILMANPAAQRDLQVLAVYGGAKQMLEDLGGYPLDVVLTWSGEKAWYEVQADSRTFEIAAKAMPESAGWVLVIRDMSREREMQAHIRQQDRLAVIGQLAGGVAHDFNNILTAIKGYASFAADELADGNPIRADIEEIRIAADRAAVLTSQLLIFSRKQIIQPQVLNLNDVIANMDKMLRRIIGEQIDIQIELDPTAGNVEADLGQIERVVMNLSVNARDAMRDGGQLKITTQNVILTSQDIESHLDVAPGPYVLLTVCDTGTGMTEEVKSYLFEPFFTTKEQGKGTGLGLSTVYGIVKQANGHIEVESQVGQGSTFRIYLPRIEAEAVTTGESFLPTDMLPCGTETILLVEDEDMVRELAHRTLERQGYTVLTARLPKQALELMLNYVGSVSLLLTDVIMPGMDGTELAQNLLQRHPDLRVIYMSGYTDNELTRHGVLDPGVVLLLKPFDPNELVQTVRKVLDAPVRI